MKKLILILCLISFPMALNAQVMKLLYEGFTVWIDCEKRGAVKFYYVATKDWSNLDRLKSFKKDPDVAGSCQQKNGKTYKEPGKSWHRGHMVPANHLDHLQEGIKQSNYMTNILPQTGELNTGAWLLTEEITECHREEKPLEVWGGAIWGNNTDNDHFVRSHGVATPDKFWKVIIKGDDAIGWILPNSHDAKKDKLDSYLKTIKKIEDAIGERLPVSDSLRDVRYTKSWSVPSGCDKS